MKTGLAGFGLALFASAVASAALAQSGGTINLADVAELSGCGATVGTNWKNGIDLAVEEINAKGGILGHKIDVTHADTQSNPGVRQGAGAEGARRRALRAARPGLFRLGQGLRAARREAEIAEIMGGEAAELTKGGNEFVFRTSFGQQISMPKIANYIADDLKAKTAAVVWVNNDFGKGGHDTILKEIRSARREGRRRRFHRSRPGRLRRRRAEGEERQSRCRLHLPQRGRERARPQGNAQGQDVKAPLVGETTLIGQKVIELAGGAANGAIAHVGLTTDAPIPAIKAFRQRFVAKYNYVPDHNGIKGYLAVYMIKAATEKMGKLDPKNLAAALHGLTITPDKEPGILMEVTIDENGDLDRESFLGEVVDGKQVIKEVLPKL